MAIRLNKVFLAGNLTRDPQVRFFANERAVANFGLATSRRYKAADGEMKEDTLYIDIECWGRTAELVGEHLVKGRGCMVEGRLKLDNWEDKEGNKRSTIRVVADNVQFTDQRPTEGQSSPTSSGGASAPSEERVPAGGGEFDDEPPF